MSARALMSPVAFGVAAMIFDVQGQVLLVRQSYVPGWRLPGGGVGRGEAPEAAVLREMGEEVGLAGGTAELFGLYSRRAGWATNLIALYTIKGGGIDFCPNWEVRDILFVAPDAPPDGTAASSLRRLAELNGRAKPSPIW